MESNRRLQFVDGLRGIAASMVVVFHFWGNLPDASRDIAPGFVRWAVERGNLGVDIFFVLSGFVIAHSIRHLVPSASYVARFALRRSIRLDPPFWLTIAIELMLIRIALAFFPDLGTPIPTGSAILANATYTYRFLGQPELVSIFWSLTYEVQFYLVLVVGAVLLAAARPGIRNSVGPVLFLGTFVYSVIIWINLLPLPLQGLFIDRWFQFALGVAAWVVANRFRSLKALGLLILGVSIAAIVWANEYRLLATLTACLVSAVLAYAGVYGRMGWLAGPTVQFLGRISYSLYLLHSSIGWRAMSLLKRVLGPDIGVLMGWGIFAVAVATSVLAAWLMFVVVERPSMNLARRIALRPRASPSGLQVAAA